MSLAGRMRRGRASAGGLPGDAPRREARENFAYLTITLVIFLILSSSVHQFGGPSAVVRIGTALLLAAGIWGTAAHRKPTAVTVILAIGIFLIFAVEIVGGDKAVAVVGPLVLLVFLCTALVAAIRQMTGAAVIDANTIFGAVCAYLLIGLIWASAYMEVYQMIPGAFAGIDDKDPHLVYDDLVYFSFGTLTTIGTGTISAVAPLPRMLTFLEGIVGQFYLAVLVARLVGSSSLFAKDSAPGADNNT